MSFDNSDSDTESVEERLARVEEDVEHLERQLALERLDRRLAEVERSVESLDREMGRQFDRFERDMHRNFDEVQRDLVLMFLGITIVILATEVFGQGL